MGGLVFVAVLIALGVSIVWLVTGRERYRPVTPPTAHMMPTSEVQVDPASGLRQRVYVDPATGVRSYVDEPGMRQQDYPPLARPGLAPGWGAPGHPPVALLAARAPGGTSSPYPAPPLTVDALAVAPVPFGAPGTIDAGGPGSTEGATTVRAPGDG